MCTKCSKRDIHENNYKVEVKVDGKKQECAYMLCECDNCGTRYVVEV